MTNNSAIVILKTCDNWLVKDNVIVQNNDHLPAWRVAYVRNVNRFEICRNTSETYALQFIKQYWANSIVHYTLSTALMEAREQLSLYKTPSWCRLNKVVMVDSNSLMIETIDATDLSFN